ncbi:MAG: ATP-binding protein [Chitinophagaceae bacterium]
MLRFGLALLFFFCACELKAQTEYSVLHYTTENGLPSNGIKGIAYDTESGYLWIGTEAGIVRFNGTRFKVFNNENTPHLNSDRMDFLEKSKDGKIYARDQDWNWFEINQNQVKFIRKTIFNYYISTKEFMQIFIDDSLKIKMIIEQSPNNTFFQEFIDLDDSLYLFRANEYRMGYASWKTKTVFYYPDEFNINNLFVLKHRIFAWIRSKGICEFNPKTKNFKPVNLYQEDGRICKLNSTFQIIGGLKQGEPCFMIRENELWEIIEGEQGQLKIVKRSNELPSQTQIKKICFDVKNNMIFIGTSSKGLVVLKPKQVVPKKNNDTKDQVRNSQYAQIVVDSNTILTNNGVLIGEPSKKERPIPADKLFFINTFNIKDSLLLYIGEVKTTNSRNSYLHSYNYKTKQTKIYSNKSSNEVFSALYSRNKIYICNNDGFGVLGDTSIEYLFKNSRRFESEFKSFAMEEVKPNIFWVATCSGLIEYNIETKTTRNLLSFLGVCIRTIKKIGNYFFIGTYGKGFYMYKDSMKTLPLDKNKYLAFAHCFMPDREGYIWISTNRGLFKVAYNDLDNAYQKNNQTIYYHYLGKNDGMDITEMNGGCAPCAVQMNAQTISFPTMDGLLWVNPEKAGTLLPAGDIYIDKIIIDKKSYSPDSLPIQTLPANTNSIDFFIDFLAWCNKENIYIEYKLKNKKEWKLLNNENTNFIHFENLPGGDYTLQIRKRNGFGVNNFYYKEIQFSIATPFYLQWWFILFEVLSGIALIAFAIKTRTRQLMLQKEKLEIQIDQKTKSLQQQNEVLEKSNQINSRLISIISHDIITPLRFMALGSKKLLDKNHVMPRELQEETITEITNTAQELQSLSTNILNWIKYQNKHRRQQSEPFAPADVIQQVFNLLGPIAAQKNIRLLSDADTQLQMVQYREPFKILLYNLITNAIQFSINSQIMVEVSEHQQTITLSVADEGVGMTESQIQNILSDEFIISSVNVDNKKGNGLGYLIIKDLVKLIQGRLTIESEKGKGTVVAVTMPSNL